MISCEKGGEGVPVSFLCEILTPSLPLLLSFLLSFDSYILSFYARLSSFLVSSFSSFFPSFLFYFSLLLFPLPL